MLKMTENRILVETLGAEGKMSAGGIHLAVDESKQQVQRGRVAAVGPGRTVESRAEATNEREYVCSSPRYSMSVKEGDEILFTSYSGVKYKHDDGKDYVILTEMEVLAIFE